MADELGCVLLNAKLRMQKLCMQKSTNAEIVATLILLLRRRSRKNAPSLGYLIMDVQADSGDSPIDSISDFQIAPIFRSPDFPMTRCPDLSDLPADLTPSANPLK
jgi:hypothetical protein